MSRDPEQSHSHGGQDDDLSRNAVFWKSSYVNVVNTTSPTLLEALRAGPAGLAWKRWHGIYEPLIRIWLTKHALLADDRDDLVQDVLTVVVRRLPEFEHNGRCGAFRLWLKTIAINTLRDSWKKKKQHPRQAQTESVLASWADPDSAMSRQWDQEHDRHLLHKLLELLKPEFEADSWAAFHKTAIEGRSVDDVAAELKITRNAIYIAKSRILTRLRQEATGLVDFD